MTHFATPPGAFSRTEHELTAIIARESAILQILSLWSLSRPATDQQHMIVLSGPLTHGFDADERWTR
jgi:hypothetical protein